MIIKHRVVYRKQIDAIKDAIEQWFTEDGEVLVTLESPREDYAMKNASDMLPSAWAGLAWDDRESGRQESERETIEVGSLSTSWSICASCERSPAWRTRTGWTSTTASGTLGESE